MRRALTHSVSLSVEHLEGRDAPATLVSPTKVTYQDNDGDDVTVTFSKAILTAGNVNSVFIFDVGGVTGSNALKQQLKRIDLTGIGAGATGTTITTVAVRSKVNGGDGFAALGEIDATGIDLGAVRIDGDLGRILAGDAITGTPGLKGLTVHSLGRFGTSTGATNLDTAIQGKLDYLRVTTDVKEASVGIHGGADGRIGSVTIGGSLLGGSSSGSGTIFSAGDMGPVTIGGDQIGGIGGTSGTIWSSGKLSGVKIGGSVIGGAGSISGRIISFGDTGPVTIGGNLSGGSGSNSGSVVSFGKLSGVTIGGSVIGGAGHNSGWITAMGDLGPVTIRLNLSGSVESEGKLSGVKIGGSVLGRFAPKSGTIFSKGDMGMVTIGGNLMGGSGPESGTVSSDSKLLGVKIGGSVIGGSLEKSGRITSKGDMGMVTIGGNLIGGSDLESGTVQSKAKLSGVKIGGSVTGGAGESSGVIVSSSDLGPVTIGGNLTGGNGLSSGRLLSGGNLAGVTIGGSVTGGAGSSSGVIVSGNEVKKVTIGGDLVGGSASGVTHLSRSGFIGAKRIASLTLGGSLIAGTDNTIGTFFDNGAIRADDDLGQILIRGSIIGNSTNPAIISARGQAAPTGSSDVAIGQLTVRGRVEFGQILAGFDIIGAARNADAQIGAVIVGGDWSASSIAAGAVPGPGGFYGDANDAKMSGGGVKDEATVSSKIISLTIGGQALGTVGGADHYGVVAENVGAVKIGGTPLVLAAGNSNDDFLVGITNDFRVNEI